MKNINVLIGLLAMLLMSIAMLASESSAPRAHVKYEKKLNTTSKTITWAPNTPPGGTGGCVACHGRWG